MKRIDSAKQVIEELGREIPKPGELPEIRKKPGQGQKRHRDGSYLTESEKAEEVFTGKNKVY
jgi:hypothetical protein